MAGIDYMRCSLCEGKAVYDADWFYRVDPDDWKGDIKVLCPACAKTNELVVAQRSEE